MLNGTVIHTCTISSRLHATEAEAVSDMLGQVVGPQGIFDLDDVPSAAQLMEDCGGNVAALNKCFPDPECGLDSGCSFCFEVKRFTVEGKK